MSTGKLSADKCYQKHTNVEFVDFLGLITKQAIRRGSFHSVDDLEATISAYIASYNERATPFIWTKTAEYLIGKINRKRIIKTRH